VKGQSAPVVGKRKILSQLGNRRASRSDWESEEEKIGVWRGKSVVETERRRWEEGRREDAVRSLEEAPALEGEGEGEGEFAEGAANWRISGRVEKVRRSQ
jgi:hypothetical protein